MIMIKKMLLLGILFSTPSVYTQLYSPFDTVSNEVIDKILSCTIPIIYYKSCLQDFANMSRVCSLFNEIFKKGTELNVYSNLFYTIKELVQNKRYDDLTAIENAISINTAFGQSFYRCFAALYSVDFSECDSYSSLKKISKKIQKVNNYFAEKEGYSFVTLCLRASCFNTIYGIKSYENCCEKTLLYLIENLNLRRAVHMSNAFNKLMWNLLLYAHLKGVQLITQKELYLYAFVKGVLNKNDVILLKYSPL